MLVYRIINKVNGKMYIGQTTKTLEQRMYQHKQKLKSGSKFRIYEAMREYGWDNFEAEVLEYVDTKEQLDVREIYYINKYNTIDDGYNLAPGGNINIMDSKEIAEYHDAVMRTPKVRAKISKSMKAYCAKNGVSEAHRKHLSENKKAFYASDKGKATLAKFKETFHLSETHKNALIQSLKKSIYCIDENGNTIQEFDSVKSAAKWWLANGLNPITVKAVCFKIKKSYRENIYINGIKWIYRV